MKELIFVLTMFFIITVWCFIRGDWVAGLALLIVPFLGLIFGLEKMTQKKG